MWSIMTLMRYSLILSYTPSFENNNFTTSNPPTGTSPTTLMAYNLNSQLITVVQVPRERGELLARQHSMAFMETSARTGVNVAQVSVTLNLN